MEETRVSGKEYAFDKRVQMEEFGRPLRLVSQDAQPSSGRSEPRGIDRNDSPKKPCRLKVASVKVDEELWKEFRILAIRQGRQVQELMKEAMEDELAKLKEEE